MLRFIERLETLEADKASIADDIKDVYVEVKALGYDVATMRAVLKQRKLEEAIRKERNGLLHAYAGAIGLELL